MPAIDKLLIATTNPGKLAEFRELLDDQVGQILSSADVDAPPVIEDADTLEGNALKKARTLLGITKHACLADDTGLEVKALDGAPGVHSARYAGESGDAGANMRKLLSEMEGKEDRRARFRTVIAFVDGHGARLFEGVCEGRILDAPRGEGGFGYDPLFLPDGESKTFAELSAERKNAISHRGRAMRAFLKDLQAR